jgi:hypothetical protein
MIQTRYLIFLLVFKSLCVNPASGDGYEGLPFYRRAKSEARLLPSQPSGDRVIRVDGDLSDWDMPADSFPIHQLLDHTVPDFHKSWKRAWEKNPTDAALIKLLHSKDALYIGVKVADNSVVSPADEGKRLHGDVVDIYLDLRPAAGKGPLMGHVKYTEGIYQIVFSPPTSDGKPIHILQPENELFTGWRSGQKVSRLGPFEAKSKIFKGGYAIEIRLPLASFPHKPASDRLTRPFGFEVMIADKDIERPEGQPDRMYYSCSGYSGGGNYFKSPSTIACTDPDLRTSLPLSRLRKNPLETAPGGDEHEGWIVTSQGEKDLDAAFVEASKAFPGFTPPVSKKDLKNPVTTYPCPALGLAFHHRRVLNRLPAWSPSTVGNRYVAVSPSSKGEIKVDGKLDDWGDFAKTASRIHEYGCMPWCAGIEGRNDVAAIKLMTADDTLYLAVEVTDDSVYSPAETDKVFTGDCVQVFIDVRDPDNPNNPLSHGKYGDGVHRFTVAPSAAKNQKDFAWAVNLKCVGTAKGYVLEMAIPLARVQKKPVPGRFQNPFGFEVLLADVDQTGDGKFLPRIHYSWGPGTEKELHQNPGFFNCADYSPNRLPEIRALMDTTPVTIKVDADLELQPFTGFGGNYFRDGALTHTGGRASRFALSAPTTSFVSRNLNKQWVRANLFLFSWEWVNDNDNPDKSSLRRFEQLGHPHEYPGPHYKVQVDKYLKLLSEFVGKNTRLCAYVENWPAWLFPDKKASGTVPRKLWPELAECLSSYMLYARDEHKIEFARFAFRRARWGHPRFEDKDYPEFIKFLGAHFEKQGLKTKLLLCDTDSVNNFRWYARMANDKKLLKYIGGIGLETSGSLDAQMANYRLWSDLARHMNVPLFITAFGRPYTSAPSYLFEEVRIWQQLLNELRPGAAMIRQLVSEKSNKWLMVRGKEVVNDSHGMPQLNINFFSDAADGVLPTQRFWITKQFCDLTPAGHAMQTSSDHPQVLVSGFTGKQGIRKMYTLHVANIGAARKATLSGLPRKVKNFHVVRTSGGEGFRRAEDLRVKAGIAELDLPAWSLVTLTTLPPKTWERP